LLPPSYGGKNNILLIAFIIFARGEINKGAAGKYRSRGKNSHQVRETKLRAKEKVHQLQISTSGDNFFN